MAVGLSCLGEDKPSLGTHLPYLEEPARQLSAVLRSPVDSKLLSLAPSVSRPPRLLSYAVNCQLSFKITVFSPGELMHSKVLNFLLGSHLLVGRKQMTKQSLSTPPDNSRTGEQIIQRTTCTPKLTYCEIKEAGGISLTVRGQIMTSPIMLLLVSYIFPEHDRISFLDFIVSISGKSLK